MSSLNETLPEFISQKPQRGDETSSSNTSDPTHIALTFDDNNRARELFGQYDEHLAIIERDLHVTAVARGNKVSLKGSAVATDQARRVLETLYERLDDDEIVDAGEVEGAIRHAIASDAQMTLPTTEKRGPHAQAGISTAKKTVHARTAMQDAYIRAMDKVELVFGAGPAGTGKTYLAVAYAASLLERGAVDRIILSRPAVEAGERLGFLPGDMKEKVDPYLRPLYDALYDMMMERIKALDLDYPTWIRFLDAVQHYNLSRTKVDIRREIREQYENPLFLKQLAEALFLDGPEGLEDSDLGRKLRSEPASRAKLELYAHRFKEFDRLCDHSYGRRKYSDEHDITYHGSAAQIEEWCSKAQAFLDPEWVDHWSGFSLSMVDARERWNGWQADIQVNERWYRRELRHERSLGLIRRPLWPILDPDHSFPESIVSA